MDLKDFEDFKAKGTLGKNNQIYTSLYDYYKNSEKEASDDPYKADRPAVVGWLAYNSQIRNFMHILPHVKNGDSILDFGCGIGDLVPFLYSNYEEFDYFGVDINPKFIQEAQDSYPNYDFYLIKSANDIIENFDTIVAIGVFTWYITKSDFVKTIKKLFSLCRRKLVLTFIHSDFAPHSWTKTYRGYNENIFLDLFPNLKDNMTFEKKERDLVVVFEK